ncbi:MAG TPA: 2OG-Fe(II) oxygenase family protein [Allosphingosinicella sp.]|nr:2OG-Fe(II) oxygenase family protein [Allosphingosinicella sp.]
MQIRPFLTEKSAERLLRHLRAREDWRLLVNQGEKLFELDRPAQQALTAAARQKLEAAIHKAAREQFQFCFETIRVPDDPGEREGDPTPLAEFARFMSSPEVLEPLRRITGCGSIGFADAQATAYGPGHFLTGHDDNVTGKNRHAAYVLSLASRWRPEWGGLLMFHRDDGNIEEALTPCFNSLNLFKVPQLHSVSYVAPFVPYRRYAVTGWLRSSSESATIAEGR